GRSGSQDAPDQQSAARLISQVTEAAINQGTASAIAPYVSAADRQRLQQGQGERQGQAAGKDQAQQAQGRQPAGQAQGQGHGEGAQAVKAAFREKYNQDLKVDRPEDVFSSQFFSVGGRGDEPQTAGSRSDRSKSSDQQGQENRRSDSTSGRAGTGATGGATGEPSQAKSSDGGTSSARAGRRTDSPSH